jgi:hypothetical protein
VARVLLDIVDGRATVDDISQDVSDVVGISMAVADSKVRSSLDLFDAAGLLETSTGIDQSALRKEIFLTPPNT